MLDVENWDFENDGALTLSGEWAFYWQELLPPAQIQPQHAATYVPVPGSWSGYNLAGRTFGAEGYATYALTVYLPQRQTYGLYIDGQGTAYSLWVDGALKAKNGQVGTSKGGMVPDNIPQTVFFEPEGERVELVIQISNFYHRRGGFRHSLYLGLAEPVHQRQMQNWYVEAFSTGILFIMGLYHLGMYFFRRKNSASLFFALLSWTLALRMGITNQNTLLFYLPVLNWQAAFRLEYLTFFWGPALLVLFFNNLYPKDMHRWFLRAVLGIAVAFTVFMLLSDTLAASYLTTYYQIVIVLEIIYTLYFLGRIVSKRREGAAYIGVASLILMLGAVVEMLIIQGFIGDIYLPSFLPIGQISSYSFLVFVFVQAVLLASRFSSSYERVESLSRRLEDLNENLIESERKYRTIFEDSKDVIFVTNLETQIEEASPAVEEVLGYSIEEVRQMKVHEVMAHPSTFDHYLAMVLDEGGVKNLEIELQRKDGSTIDTLVTINLRRDEDGEIIGFQGSVRDITARKQAEAERLRAMKFEQIAITDPLTEIYNRRFFFETAEKEIARASRSKSTFSIILFDVDNFKKVNDTYGHLVGDDALVAVTRFCKRNVRGMDLLARFGGEEFVILMPDTSSEHAYNMAERLRRGLEAYPLVKIDEVEVTVTLSMGITEWRADDPIDIDTLLTRADKALYKAKRQGRNRVMIWGQDEGGTGE